MKKYLFLMVLLIMTATPTLSWAQSAPYPGNGGQPDGDASQRGSPPQAGQMPPEGQSAQGPSSEGNGMQHFQEHKAEMLKRLGNHMAEVQQRMGCVQAASTPQALRACMPERAPPPSGQ